MPTSLDSVFNMAMRPSRLQLEHHRVSPPPICSSAVEIACRVSDQTAAPRLGCPIMPLALDINDLLKTASKIIMSATYCQLCSQIFVLGNMSLSELCAESIYGGFRDSHPTGSSASCGRSDSAAFGRKILRWNRASPFGRIPCTLGCIRPSI